MAKATKITKEEAKKCAAVVSAYAKQETKIGMKKAGKTGKKVSKSVKAGATKVMAGINSLFHKK